MGEETVRYFITEIFTHKPTSSGNEKITFVIAITITDSASLLDEVTIMTYFENICKMRKTYKGY